MWWHSRGDGRGSQTESGLRLSLKFSFLAGRILGRKTGSTFPENAAFWLVAFSDGKPAPLFLKML
jgi:hypothetical protein